VIIAIVAVAKNLAIGKDGKLPWHYPADLKFFKDTTTGNAVVMGANTFEAIGKALPNRLNVVLSRRRRIDSPDVMQLASFEEVVELSKYLNRDIYIIGGAKTYEAFADVIDKWLVTEVPIDVPDADVFMPGDFLDDFEVDAMRDLGDGLIVRTLTRRTE
jgi:dihydrofolate reductase